MGAGNAAKPRILAILQARMSSSRLPGKVMKPILGRPMIGRHIDRLKRCTGFDRLIIATSTDKSDDVLADFVKSEGIECFRGSLGNVLDRFESAVRANPGYDHIVRLTADCPVADPKVIDDIIAAHLAGGYDYTSNSVDRTFPDGLDAEIMTRQALATMAAEAKDPYELEHVTPFIYRRRDRFRVHQVLHSVDLNEVRWTVDTPDDFLLVDTMYRELLPKKEDFDFGDMLQLVLRRPDIAVMNYPNGYRSAAKA